MSPPPLVMLQPPIGTLALPPGASDDITVIKIFDALRSQIIAGTIPPGTSINSVDIANEFGTSRTPVREALLMLQQYRLVTLVARRRPQVAPVSVKAIRDLYALRATLHTYLSHAIVAAASDEALRQLHGHALALKDQFDELSVEDHLSHIEAYRATELALADNDEVLSVLETLKWRIAWFRRLGGMSRDELRVFAEDRVRISSAYLERDGGLAEALNRSLLMKAARYCEQRFAKHELRRLSA